MKKHFVILTISTLSLLALFACSGEENKNDEPVIKDQTELLTKAQTMFAVLPMSIENPENPQTPEKVALGKKLFYDTRLSKEGKIAVILATIWRPTALTIYLFHQVTKANLVEEIHLPY